jgi:hypothetical protein
LFRPLLLHHEGQMKKRVSYHLNGNGMMVTDSNPAAAVITVTVSRDVSLRAASWLAHRLGDELACRAVADARPRLVDDSD